MDAALNRPFATFGGEDLFPTHFDKAAAIMHGIITGHPFLDGNKRTGYELGRLLLQEGGHDVEATLEERYDMVILIATGQLEVAGIKDWLDAHSKSI